MSGGNCRVTSAAAELLRRRRTCWLWVLVTRPVLFLCWFRVFFVMFSCDRRTVHVFIWAHGERGNLTVLSPTHRPQPFHRTGESTVKGGRGCSRKRGAGEMRDVNAGRLAPPAPASRLKGRVGVARRRLLSVAGTFPSWTWTSPSRLCKANGHGSSPSQDREPVSTLEGYRSILVR